MTKMTLEELNQLEENAERAEREADTLRFITNTIRDARQTISRENAGKGFRSLDSALNKISSYRDSRDLVEKEVLKILPDLCRVIELRLQGQARDLSVRAMRTVRTN